MKKLFAILLAVSMIMAVAINASAAETTLPDQTFDGWWTAWSQGVEITAEGVTITFDAKSAEGAVANYQSPSLVIHAGSADALGTEYWVQRADSWGWLYGENVGDHADALKAKGYSWEYSWSEGFTWEGFVSAKAAGASATVTAKLEGSNVLLSYSYAGCINNVTIPVDTSAPVYLAITGEACSISNVKVVTPDPEPEIPVEPAASYTAELNVNWDSNPRSNVVIDGPGEYSMNVDMTYWGEGSVGYANVIIPDAYEALKGYTANLKVTLGDTVVYDSAITPNPQYVDDGTGNYVASNNYYIELFASWNETNLIESIPYGSNMVVTLTLTDPNAVTPDTTNPKDGDSISVIVALMAVSACGIAVVAKKKEF